MPRRPARATFRQRCFYDDHGNKVLGQPPNGLQIAGWIALLASWPLAGKPGHAAALIAFGAWFGWAWLEVFQGVNYFRRSLGVSVFMLLAVAALR